MKQNVYDYVVSTNEEPTEAAAKVSSMTGLGIAQSFEIVTNIRNYVATKKAFADFVDALDKATNGNGKKDVFQLASRYLADLEELNFLPSGEVASNKLFDALAALDELENGTWAAFL